MSKGAEVPVNRNLFAEYRRHLNAGGNYFECQYLNEWQSDNCRVLPNPRVLDIDPNDHVMAFANQREATLRFPQATLTLPNCMAQAHDLSLDRSHFEDEPQRVEIQIGRLICPRRFIDMATSDNSYHFEMTITPVDHSSHVRFSLCNVQMMGMCVTSGDMSVVDGLRIVSMMRVPREEIYGVSRVNRGYRARRIGQLAEQAQASQTTMLNALGMDYATEQRQLAEDARTQEEIRQQTRQLVEVDFSGIEMSIASAMQLGEPYEPQPRSDAADALAVATVRASQLETVAEPVPVKPKVNKWDHRKKRIILR